MLLPQNSKRPWVAGRPKFTNGELKKVIVLLSDKHVSFLREQQGGASACLRMLLDRYMAEQQDAGANTSQSRENAPGPSARKEGRPARR